MNSLNARIAMRLFFMAILLLCAGTSVAADASQRALFRDALTAAQQGRLDARPDLRSRLQTYPLYNYLSAAELRYRLDTDANAALDTQIEKFIAAHPDLPPAESLRRNWLPSLARRDRWSMLLANTRDSDGGTATCRAVNARIQLGQNPRSEALALWRVGRSQPDACDPVFAWLDRQGLLGANEIRERARLAVLAGQYGLARYLARQLPENQRTAIDRWLDVAETPANLNYASAGLDGDIAVYAFKRYALRDLDGAADLFSPLAERLQLDAAQRHEMKRQLALLYAQSQQPQALVWFARMDHARMRDDEHALGWEIRAAIYNQRWPLVVDAINDLPPAIGNDEEWRYWHARALDAMGRSQQARALYAPLAAERSYHGYLAADALNQDYSLNERPLAVDPAARARVEAKPALARAYELRALGMDHAANLEWNAVIDGLDQAALAQAARIAHEWGWHSRAIITLVKADYWDDLDIRYPTPYSDAVRQFADDNDLDPAYVYAIMRTESLFQPAIRSSAGAVGLMQLLPGTARLVARRMDASTPSSSALTIPEINIQLGAGYLAQMRERWDGNIAMATASYNAGPQRIARWLPDDDMDPTIWIANIPYTETRNYVQRAMSHMTVFQARLNEHIVPLDKRIDDIRPGYGDRTAQR
ncbi:transglycosylase SLT domain-containing protein [Salinisphaera sp. T5B8]|uniref:transglycosylase SLT domain-containing protein n=1 Tax=Salinisphaera sp. T5B8 TaxID=1304154 RepID=UPI0033428AFB